MGEWAGQDIGGKGNWGEMLSFDAGGFVRLLERSSSPLYILVREKVEAIRLRVMSIIDAAPFQSQFYSLFLGGRRQSTTTNVSINIARFGTVYRKTGGEAVV